MTTTNYPDGSVLTSSALTLDAINTILQQLTLGMVGQPVTPDNDFVRIAWQTEGAPFNEVDEDRIYLKCVFDPVDPYSKSRDRVNLVNDETTITEQWNYTRVWHIKWVCYGPNSADLARAIWTAMFQDYFTNALEGSQLFPVSDFDEPQRAPELMNGQWMDRCDFKADMYECVTETISRQTAISVETILEDASGVLADFTTSAT